MSKVCAKCEKPVYPTEELKCLDKVWHKTCFKCWECGMSLSMKNYKGYDKKPYCVAHYPQTKATVVAETPELARLTQASKNQSQARYHEEFEKKIKGSKIQVADDPETQRLKQLNSIVSQVEYKGIKEKVTDMETRRQNVAASDSATHPCDVRPQSGSSDDGSANANWSSPYTDRNVSHSTTYTTSGKVEPAQARKIGSISDYEPPTGPAIAPHSVYQPIGSSSRQRQEWEETVPMSNAAPYQQFVQQQQQQMKEQQLREQQAREQQLKEQQIREQQFREQQMREQQVREQQIREQQLREQQLREQQLREQQQQLREQQLREQQMREQQIREQQLREQQLREQQLREQQQQLREQQLREQQLRDQQLRQQQQQQMAYMNQPASRVPPVNAPLSSGFAGPVYQAMYDYDAQDDDEVGFRENDLIVNVEPIDEGWMFGTVQRTGVRGMLPANYVERIK